MKKCYIIKNGKDFYNRECEWEEAYINEDKINYLKYKDPDVNCLEFYEDLAMFLNVQEERIKGLIGKFRYSFSSDPLGIKVKDNENNIWFLKSDQLGFSAPSRQKRSPYDLYIDKSLNKDNARILVSKWIFESRSIGGSFIWPMEKNGEEWITNPQYNKLRGKSPIYDRADMTLLDIRNCFLVDKKSWLLYQYNNKNNMKKWINHFGSGEDGFKTYIKFFSFESFIENDYPKDLTTNGGLLKDFNDSKYKISFKEYSLETIYTILHNLNLSIKERSESVEEIIIKIQNA